MAHFHVVVTQELTADDRETLESQGCEIVVEFGPGHPGQSDPPIPHDDWEELEDSTGYVTRVQADDDAEARERVGDALDIDEEIWRAYPAGALP
jgi:hypothetical protein